MDVLIFDDQNAYQEKIRLLETGRLKFNVLVMAYNALGLAALATSELPTLVNAPETLLFNKITASQPLQFAGGVAVNAAKAFDWIEKLAGTDALLEKVKSFRNDLSQSGHLAWLYTPDNFAIVSGALVVKAAFLTDLQEQHKYYAKTAVQKAVLTEVQAIVTALNNIRASGLGTPFDAHFLEDATRRAGNGNLEVNPGYITRISR
jgi:hypothetical protein